MPLNALDPRTALIVIDLQKGTVDWRFIHPIGEIVGRPLMEERGVAS